uniref:Reverse transcriptase domain-containing protein n=1 Tax=Toxocara canis TaxID=6265 RepID=A0A183US93_TOXCA
LDVVLTFDDICVLVGNDIEVVVEVKVEVNDEVEEEIEVRIGDKVEAEVGTEKEVATEVGVEVGRFSPNVPMLDNGVIVQLEPIVKATANTRQQRPRLFAQLSPEEFFMGGARPTRAWLAILSLSSVLRSFFAHKSKVHMFQREIIWTTIIASNIYERLIFDVVSWTMESSPHSDGDKMGDNQYGGILSAGPPLGS